MRKNVAHGRRINLRAQRCIILTAYPVPIVKDIDAGFLAHGRPCLISVQCETISDLLNTTMLISCHGRAIKVKKRSPLNFAACHAMTSQHFTKD
jgi:hypothetical protein